MKRVAPFFAPWFVCFAAFGCGAGATSKSTTIGNNESSKSEAQEALSSLTNNSTPVCKTLANGLHCMALGRTNTSNKLWVSNAPVAGFGAADLQSAYNIPTSGGAGVTVALVDYMDDPTAEDDLATYRSQNGLKACTSLTGCFTKVDEYGEVIPPPSPFSNAASQPASTPAVDPGWDFEISLDLDMVSAACPNCKIILVEALPNSFDDAGLAIQTAVQLGATVISNSWGFPEGAGIISDGETHYLNIPGVTIFASTGDDGFGVGYPASSQYVIAAGGTNLAQTPNSARGWTETAWSGAGSGCSAYVTKPAWQTDAGCAQRTVADISAVADPYTGVAMYGPNYDDTGTYIGSGWSVSGGTSVSSPLLAGIWAASGLAGNSASWIYANTGAFNDVTQGATGLCNGSYLCTAGPGYDGPTGVGTPDASLFTPSPASPNAKN